jgi:diguanylate cyclase (GGDEF)-like protein/PAS domain S-box-containing protein
MRVLEKLIQVNDSLRAEKQLDLTYRRIKLVFWATVSVSAMLVVALWSVVDHGTLLAWLLSQGFVMAVRLVLLRRHYKKKIHAGHWKWKTEYAIGSAFAGLNWGITLFVFNLELHEPTTLFMILVIFALGAYGSVSMASVLSSAVAFLLPLLLSLTVWFFPRDHFLAASTLIYLGLMLMMARQVHKVILAAHLTTIENEAQKIALLESGKRMTDYFENAPGFFFTLLRKPDGHISMPFASTGITALFGLQPEALAESVAPLAALYNPEDRELVFAEMQRSGQTLTPCRVMFRASHPEKGEIWVEARSVPQQDEGGNIRWNGFMQDVTEQKQAEVLLQKRESEFRALAENAPDPIYRYDRNCRRIYINKAVEQMTGVPLAKIWGKSPSEALPVPSVDALKAEQAIRRVLDTGKPGELEVSFVAADGRDTTVHNLLVPEFAADGSVESVLCIGRDVTARKYMTDVLAKSERSFRTLAENATDNIARHDQQCRFVYLNPNFETTLGLSTGFLLNKTPMQVFSDGILDEYEKVMEQVIASGHSADHYLMLPGERYHHVRLTPEKNDNGEVSGVLVIGRDITELKRMERALLESEEKHRTVFESANDAIILHRIIERNGNTEFILHDLNQKGCELWGHSRTDILSGNFDLLAMNNPPYSFEEATRRNLLAAAGEPQLFDWEHKRPDGSKVWGEVNLRRIQIGEQAFLLAVTRNIDERKATEQALQTREREFRTLAESFPDVIIRYDRDYRRIYMNNPALLTMEGKAQDELINSTPANYTPLTAPDTYMAVLRKVIDSGEAAALEVEMRRGQGELAWYMSSFVPEFDRHGNIVGALMVARDLTEYKRLRESEKESQARYRQIFENSQEGIFLFDVTEDRRFRMVEVNPAFERLVGIPREAMVGKFHEEILPEEMEKKVAAKYRRCLAAGTVYEEELELELPAGKLTYFSTLVPIKDERGRIIRISGITRDVTAQKLAQKALLQREQEFRALSENSPDTIMRYDLECRRIYVNPAFIKLSGLPAEALLGGTPTQYSSAPQAHAYENALRRVLQSGEPGEHEYAWPAKGGREIISHFRLTPEWEADGKLTSVLAIGRDITEYKKAEAALQKNFMRLTEFHRHLEVQTNELQASQEQLKQALEFSEGVVSAIPDILFEMDSEGRYHNVWTQNPAVQEAQKTMLVGKIVHEVLSPEAAACAMEAIREADKNGVAYGKVIAITQTDGEVRWYEHSLAKKLGGTHANARFIALSRDITERKRMEEALVKSEQELRALIDNSPDTIARYDRDCRRTYVNPVFAGMVQGGAAALLGKTPTECPGGTDSDMYESKLKEVFVSGENSEFELHWTDHEGREICSHIRLAAEHDTAGKVISVLAVGRDISELNLHRKRIYRMAFYDALTSLPNRALFNDRMNQMLADALWHEQQAGVMLLDLDRFKAINDTLGHAAGDRLLSDAAARLSYCVRGYDTVARLGGDEFAILLPEVRSGDDLGRVARKILESFNQPFILEGKEVFVGCSIGIAVYPSDGETADDLLKQADSAMYFAKRSGRNTFRFYSSDLTDSANESLTLETDLRHGFVRGELELYYQPKVRMADGVVIGSEALLRWHHPERGLVPPDQYISIAEDCGLIVEIGEWVLHNACRTAGKWNGPDKPLHKVAINLSARQFMSGDLVKTVQRVLAETGCKPEWIELEITESLLLDEDGIVLDMLGTFRAMGITMAIDDFGTGYSALSYLARFPIDTLKIDRSFTSRISEAGHHAELVKAIISIAHSLNQTVVAEGVETAEEAAFLLAHGCHIAQGYLYSKAVPKKQFELLPVAFGLCEVIA